MQHLPSNDDFVPVEMPSLSQEAPAASAPVDWAQRDRELLAQVAEINARTQARQISAEELQARLAQGETIVLLDVREAHENEVSALAGARLVLPAEVRTVPLDDIPADATVVTYCTVGARGGMAAVILEERMGRPVQTLTGGIIGWYNHGGQVVDPSGNPVNRVDPVEELLAAYVHPR
jgi:rhodanese-related sulfurtransferase